MNSLSADFAGDTKLGGKWAAQINKLHVHKTKALTADILYSTA